MKSRSTSICTAEVDHRRPCIAHIPSPSSSLIILHHQLARLPPSSIHSPPSPTLRSLLLLYVVSCKRWQLVFSKNPKSPNGGHFGGSLVIFVFVCRPLPPSVNTSFSNHHVGRSISAYNFLYVHHPEPRIIVIRHALNHHLQSAVGIQVLVATKCSYARDTVAAPS